MKIFNKLFMLSLILILSSCYTQFKTVTYSTPNRTVTTTTEIYSYPYYTSPVYYNYYNPLRPYSSFYPYTYYRPYSYYYYNPYYRDVIIVDNKKGKDKPKPKTTSYTPPKNTPIRTSGVNRSNTTTSVRSTTPSRQTTTEVRRGDTPSRTTTPTQRSGEVKRTEPTKSSEVRKSGTERTETKPQRSNTTRGEVRKNEN